MWWKTKNPSAWYLPIDFPVFFSTTWMSVYKRQGIKILCSCANILALDDCSILNLSWKFLVRPLKSRFFGNCKPLTLNSFLKFEIILSQEYSYFSWPFSFHFIRRIFVQQTFFLPESFHTYFPEFLIWPRKVIFHDPMQMTPPPHYLRFVWLVVTK